MKISIPYLFLLFYGDDIEILASTSNKYYLFDFFKVILPRLLALCKLFNWAGKPFELRIKFLGAQKAQLNFKGVFTRLVLFLKLIFLLERNFLWVVKCGYAFYAFLCWWNRNKIFFYSMKVLKISMESYWSCFHNNKELIWNKFKSVTEPDLETS